MTAPGTIAIATMAGATPAIRETSGLGMTDLATITRARIASGTIARAMIGPGTIALATITRARIASGTIALAMTGRAMIGRGTTAMRTTARAAARLLPAATREATGWMLPRIGRAARAGTIRRHDHVAERSGGALLRPIRWWPD
jgi:hypothetical protein